MTDTIRFTDGAAYERYMGVWSRLVGEAFLDWLTPPLGQRWLDVGCGNGAFTELILQRCAPTLVEGIDPSEEQLAFARSRFAPSAASFRIGDAQALPFEAGAFDAAVMPLVIFFVPEPPQGVAEMARVVRPGGEVTAYAWDMPGGGFPYAMVQAEMRAMGLSPPMTPNPDVSSLDALRGLWTGAGLQEVATREITVQRTYSGFEDYWETICGGPSLGARLKTMTAEEKEALRERMRSILSAGASGRIRLSARANAVKGRVGAGR